MRRLERSARSDTFTRERSIASERESIQPSFPFGRSGTVTPSQRPRTAATASTRFDPNSVRGPSAATVDPPGLERSSTVWPARTRATV